MARHSFSKIDLYRQCPRAYYYRYHKKIKGRPSRALLIGRTVHEAIAEYDRHLQQTGLDTDVTKVEEITNQVIQKNPELEPDAASEVAEIMDRMATSHRLNPNAQQTWIEKEIHLPIPDTDHTLIAYIDRVELGDGRAKVIDYKTDWRIRGATEVAKDPQLHTYAWLIKELTGIPEITAALEFVRYAAVIETQISLEKAEAEIERMKGTIQQIEQDKEFKPRPGSRCEYCEYLDHCEGVTSGVDAITDEEEARAVAGEIAHLEAKAKQKKELLKKWANVNGPVTAGGLVWGFHEEATRKVEDPQGFINRLEVVGKDPYQYITVDGRKLATLLKDEEIEPLLQEIISHGSRTSFRAKKEAQG